MGIAPGLVEHTSSAAGFLQVIQVGQTLSGTWTFYQYDASGTDHVSQGTWTVTGFVQGTSIQLTFNDTKTDLGTLAADGTVTLQVVQPDGSLSPVTLTPGTSADYNADLVPVHALVNQWSNVNWGTVVAKACVLADGTHDVRVFVSSGGTRLCTAAQNLGYTVVTNYLTNDTVLCLGYNAAVLVAVADDFGGVLGGDICAEVTAGTFPTAPAPS